MTKPKFDILNRAGSRVALKFVRRWRKTEQKVLRFRWEAREESARRMMAARFRLVQDLMEVLS